MSKGGTDPAGWLVCKAFKSGPVYMKYAYEQTLVEVTVGPIHGDLDEDRGTVTFHGVTELESKGSFADSVEGRVVWQHATKKKDCWDTTSQVYLGDGEYHAQRDNPEEEVGSMVVIRRQDTGQYAGFQLRGTRDICGRPCFGTQVAGFAVCMPEGQDDQRDHEFRPDVGGKLEDPQLATQMGFLHIDTNLRMYGRLSALLDSVCQVEMAGWRGKLHAMAGSDQPYALLDRYGRGYTMQVAGAAAYVIKCAATTATRAEYSNCTQEVPVMVDGKVRFADPLTWILQDFPTVVPCSPVMPVRWNILGKWYCATPEIRACIAPTRFSSNLNQTAEGDFARGLGRGIFTESQMAQHLEFWRSTTSRKAVVAKASNAASAGGHGGHLGLVVTDFELGKMTDQVVTFLFPLFPYLGYAWATVSGVYLFLSFVKGVIECLVRMVVVYMDEGCGWWILVGLINSIWQAFHMPHRLVTSAVDRLKGQFDPLAVAGRSRRGGPNGARSAEEGEVGVDEAKEGAASGNTTAAAVYAQPRAALYGMEMEDASRWHEHQQ